MDEGEDAHLSFTFRTLERVHFVILWGINLAFERICQRSACRKRGKVMTDTIKDGDIAPSSRA